MTLRSSLVATLALALVVAPGAAGKLDIGLVADVQQPRIGQPVTLRLRACPVTVARGRLPRPVPRSFNYGNASIAVALDPANGTLIAGRLRSGGYRATINPDGSIYAKFGWWRAGSGKIRITGRRLDEAAPPLQADVPDGYPRGFQATGLTFPTIGCWRITGRFGTARLTFTILVKRSPLGR